MDAVQQEPADCVRKADLVRAAYQLLLGREPESEAVIEQAVASCRTAADVLGHFLTSSEFRDSQERRELFALVRRGLHSDAPTVEVRVTAAKLEQLFERIRLQWSSLGEREPYWSVMTNDRFRMSSIDTNRTEFENSGKHALLLFEKALARCGIVIPATATCLELGCGVGRITRYLSGKFANIIGVDISVGNLVICDRYLQHCRIGNAETKLLASPGDVSLLPEFDVLFSVIVLQHNPPPIIKYMLDELLAKIRPGGFAYFQVPTNTLNYKFSVDSYLASEPAVLDMHLLPMPEVLTSISNAGLKLHEVLLDTWTGLYGSHTFLASRPG